MTVFLGMVAAGVPANANEGWRVLATPGIVRNLEDEVTDLGPGWLWAYAFEDTYYLSFVLRSEYPVSGDNRNTYLNIDSFIMPVSDKKESESKQERSGFVINVGGTESSLFGKDEDPWMTYFDISAGLAYQAHESGEERRDLFLALVAGYGRISVPTEDAPEDDPETSPSFGGLLIGAHGSGFHTSSGPIGGRWFGELSFSPGDWGLVDFDLTGLVSLNLSMLFGEEDDATANHYFEAGLRLKYWSMDGKMRFFRDGAPYALDWGQQESEPELSIPVRYVLEL